MLEEYKGNKDGLVLYARKKPYGNIARVVELEPDMTFQVDDKYFMYDGRILHVMKKEWFYDPDAGCMMPRLMRTGMTLELNELNTYTGRG